MYGDNAPGLVNVRLHNDWGHTHFWLSTMEIVYHIFISFNFFAHGLFLFFHAVIDIMRMFLLHPDGANLFI